METHIKPTSHEWTEHCRRRISDAYSAAMAILICVEDGAHIWRGDEDLIDMAIENLKAAKALHFARQKKEAA